MCLKLGQQTAGLGDIERHLGFEGFQSVEAEFVAETVAEVDADVGIVGIAFVVEQEDLTAPTLALDGRVEPDVQRADMNYSPQFYLHGVDTGER